MSEGSLGQKISWFLYQKGLSAAAKPDYLNMARFADPEWFKVAEALIKDKSVGGRELALDYLLEPRNFARGQIRRPQILKMTGFFLSKGLLDERRRVVKFVDDNARLFTDKDDPVFGPLVTAQRDSDTVISLTAETAIKKIKGEEPAGV